MDKVNGLRPVTEVLGVGIGKHVHGYKTARPRHARHTRGFAPFFFGQHHTSMAVIYN
jgi:hypothetical protein